METPRGLDPLSFPRTPESREDLKRDTELRDLDQKTLSLNEGCRK